VLSSTTHLLRAGLGILETLEDPVGEELFLDDLMEPPTVQLTMSVTPVGSQWSWVVAVRRGLSVEASVGPVAVVEVLPLLQLVTEKVSASMTTPSSIRWSSSSSPRCDLSTFPLNLGVASLIRRVLSLGLGRGRGIGSRTRRRCRFGTAFRRLARSDLVGLRFERHVGLGCSRDEHADVHLEIRRER
jgi:hypothetical protein